ncbi:MAG TPA: cysteine desulfurase, partial [Burkholderiaceae bacterium]|nr:cysteine desulfurase [Burkholderiaceae bacterium]
MTTLTPTSEPTGSGLAGLPDVALLTQLAGEFFAALPGAEPGGPALGAQQAAVPVLEAAPAGHAHAAQAPRQGVAA